jgi:membrane fusion protein (multidrug efflux system)
MSKERSSAWWRGPALLAVWCLALAFAGCGNKQTPGQQEGEGGPPAGDPEDEKPVPVAIADAATGPIASYYEATASLEAEKEAEVLARVGGVVKALLVEEGHQVAAGAPLLRIDNDEYRLRMEQATARTAQLRSVYERMKEMAAEELASAEELETAHSALSSAEADEGLARLNLEYTTVTAPFAGRVTRRLVNLGDNINSGTPLFAVADFDPLLARVHVPSREFRKLSIDQKVELVLDSTGERIEGRITLISPIIDPTSGTIKLTVEVPDYPQGTRPGDFASVRIVTEMRPSALLVPRTAVLNDRGENVVYAVVAGEPPTAERRVVETGFTDDEHTQIISGLAAGAQVVVKGQRSLKPGSKLKILTDDGDAAAAPVARQGGV